MGEVGSYVLHLYCDSPAETCPEISGRPHEATGPNLKAARANAREGGWTRPSDNGDVLLGSTPRWFCPTCSALREATDG